MQSPSGTQQENPITTSSNVVPGLATPVFQPTNPYVGPTPLSWSGPQVSALVPSIADNASLINEWADASTSKKMTPCQIRNLLRMMAIHYNGTSGVVNLKARLTRSRSLMTLN